MVNMFALFFFSKQLDREIGTVYSLIIAFHSMILVSVVYLFVMYLCKVSFVVSFYNFAQHCGFSAVCFMLYTFYCRLKKNRHLTFDFVFVPVTGMYAPLVVMLMFKLLFPNSSSVCHFFGYVSVYWFGEVLTYFILPRAEWIADWEKKVNLYKKDAIGKFIMYVSVDSNETVVNNVKEINNFMKFKFMCKTSSVRGVTNNNEQGNNRNNGNASSSSNSNSNNNHEQEMQVITN